MRNTYLKTAVPVNERITEAVVDPYVVDLYNEYLGVSLGNHQGAGLLVLADLLHEVMTREEEHGDDVSGPSGG